MPIVNMQDSKECERYNSFVEQSPYGGATQDLCWATVKEGWGSEAVYLEKGGEITAAMSILVKKSIVGSVLYATRGPVCDPYDIATIKALIAEAKPLAKKHRAFLLTFDPEVLQDNKLVDSYIDAGFTVRGVDSDQEALIQPRLNMVLNLTGKDEENIMPQFSEKTRYNIRLANRKGVTVRWSRDIADLETFFKLSEITGERDGIGIRNLDYLKRLLEAFPDDKLRIYLGEHEGEALSGAIAINYGNKMWYIYGASSNEKRNLMPNHAMQWEMIKWAMDEGKTLYDFGGVYSTSKENGLYRFKEGFCRVEGVSEYIGEIDYVYNKFVYKVVYTLLPKLRRLKKRLRG